jgi:hypothetical protein
VDICGDANVHLAFLPELLFRALRPYRYLVGALCYSGTPDAGTPLVLVYTLSKPVPRILIVEREKLKCP